MKQIQRLVFDSKRWKHKSKIYKSAKNTIKQANALDFLECLHYTKDRIYLA